MRMPGILSWFAVWIQGNVSAANVSWLFLTQVNDVLVLRDQA